MIINQLNKVCGEVFTDYVYPDSLYDEDVENDYESGGVDLNDTSFDLFNRVWEFYRSLDNTNRIEVRPLDDINDVSIIYTAPVGQILTNITGCFDGNMNPAVGWERNGSSFLRYYNPQSKIYEIKEFYDSFSPKLSLDDKRIMFKGEYDVIFLYLNKKFLKSALLRERFGFERILYTFSKRPRKITHLGMNQQYRLQVSVNLVSSASKINLINT